MLEVDEALRIVLETAQPLERQDVPFREAVGRALFEDIAAPLDQPPFDRSAMDGYALRAEDVPAEGCVLQVVGEIPAGHPDRVSVGPGQAARIMTGAPIPPGADAVQIVELTESLDLGRRVRIRRAVERGEHVRYRGEDLRAGCVILRAGMPLRAAEIALLSALGIVRVPARRAPRVSLVSTGDEIVEPECEPLAHQIRNSNCYGIEAILREMEIPSEYLGIARDDRAALASFVRRGLGSDVLCLTGGVSMGDYDLVGEVLRAEGVEILFHRVAIRPGKPLMFGRRAGTLGFGLPGNPVSAMCDFAVFTVPALRRMLGYSRPRHTEVEGILEEQIHQKPGRDYYCPARVEWREGAYRVHPVSSTGSADLAALCRANAFAIVPANVDGLPAGARLRLLLWGKGF